MGKRSREAAEIPVRIDRLKNHTDVLIFQSQFVPAVQIADCGRAWGLVCNGIIKIKKV